MKPSLPFAEFYITNVCNLKCRNCNRYNNYNFKGMYEWDDCYEQWAEKIDIEEISILGGEPAVHPRLETWAANIRRCWPNAHIFVQTNGTRPIDSDMLWEKHKVGLGVSLHDRETAEELRTKWPQAVDNMIFHQSAIIEKDGKFVLHDSDTTLAFNACDVKYSHTFLNGKLYKCATMSVLPEFIKQFDVEMTPKQKQLVESFVPLEHTATQEEILEFIAMRDTKIPQCALCPAELTWQYAYGDDSPQPEPGFD